MADQREHQEELPQENLNHHLEASTSGANAQIANLTRLVEELTQKYSSQQSQMESIATENQFLKNQLMTLNNQAAYSYYYNPYAGYSSGANAGGWQTSTSQYPRGLNAGGWQPATPHHPQGAGNNAHSPVAPMQPLSTPGNTASEGERHQQQQRQEQQQQQPQQQADQFGTRQHAVHTQRSTPELSRHQILYLDRQWTSKA